MLQTCSIVSAITPPPRPSAAHTCRLLTQQVRMLKRTPAGTEFHRLLASADVILHPFPFGGSKTSADGIALGKRVDNLAFHRRLGS